MGFENGALFRCTLHAKSPSEQEVVNVFHYNMEGGIIPSGDVDDVAQELADRLRDDLEAPFRALLPTDWTMEPVVCMQERDPLNPNAGRIARQAAPTGTAGTRVLVGEALPTAAARVYTLTTGFVGRRFRGRKFVGGLTLEGDIGTVRNNWNDPLASNFAFLADAYMAAVPRQPDLVTGPSGNTTFWALYSRTQRAGDLDPYAEAITGVTPRDSVFWLRSRQVGN